MEVIEKDIVRVAYKELFSVRFAHTAYGFPRPANIADDISIMPDAETKLFFANYGMSYRLIGNALVCFIRSRPAASPAGAKTPFIHLPAAVRIRFLLQSSTEFIKKTFLVAAGSQWLYHFTNKGISNTDPGNVFITRAVETHSMGKPYQQGTIVNNTAADKLYTAVQTIPAGNVIAITDEDFWAPAGPSEPVVNNKDLQSAGSAEVSENCFGVIDIQNTGTLGDRYKLYDNDTDQRLMSPVFTIAFKSRI